MGTVAQPTFVGTTNTDGGFSNQSNISCHSDGTLVTAIKDGTGGSTTNIKILTSADGGTTWTQRASINAPVAIQRVAIAQYVNGNIALVAKQADELGFRHCTITWGTWAVSAWDATAQTYAAPNKMGQFDVDVSDNGAVTIAFQMWNGSSSFYLVVYHRSTAGVWASIVTDNQWYVGGETRRTPAEDVSIVSLGASGSVRTYIIASSVCSSKDDGGIEFSMLRVNESTNVVTDLNSSKPGNRLALYYQGYGVSTSVTSGVKRRVKLFRTGPNTWTRMVYVAPSSGSPWFSSGTYDTLPTGTAYTENNDYGGFSYVPSAYASQVGGVSFTVDGSMNRIFRYSVTGGSTLSPRIVGDVHFSETSDTASGYEYGLVYWSATSNIPLVAMGHGVRRNLGLARQSFMYQFWITQNSTAPIIQIHEAPPNPGGNSAIVLLSPPPLAEQQLANPSLTAVVDTNSKYSQSSYGIEWQFATDSAFATNLVTYRQPLYKKKQVAGTDTDGVTVTFGDTLPSAYNLSKTIWYMRARLVDLYGNAGAWTASQSFTVGHPPSGKPTSPTGGGCYNWNGGQRTFTWDFYDPSPTDYQTAYRVVCTNIADGTSVFDTGKVVSSAKSYTHTFAGSAKDQDLQWSVQLWDSDDSQGPMSAVASFNLTDPPTATIEDPTPAEAMPTGVPTFIFTPSTSGGRTIKEYTVVVTRGPNIVWSKRVPAGIASGTQQQVKMEQGWLENNTNYSVQILVTDSANVQGSSPVVQFSTAWIPPAAPTGVAVRANKYNTEDEGFVLVSWDDAARDVDFVSWSLLRKADMIDHAGSVVDTGEWVEIFRDYSTGAVYAYKDFFAPASHLVTYRVVQSINRIGQDMDSLPAQTGSIVPLSDGYWLIKPTSDNTDADAFKLSIVTGDSFSDDQEEAEFTVIGRGRVVNKGQKLGVKGTLDVQLRNTGGTTARQKRLRLMEAQKEVRQLYLRNPFGDIFRVSVSGMSISRIAGVGHDEFCDVSIPYSEVS